MKIRNCYVPIGKPFVHSRRKLILWLNVLRFVRRSTILESKPELLEKVVKKSHHNGNSTLCNAEPSFAVLGSSDPRTWELAALTTLPYGSTRNQARRVC